MCIAYWCICVSYICGFIFHVVCFLQVIFIWGCPINLSFFGGYCDTPLMDRAWTGLYAGFKLRGSPFCGYWRANRFLLGIVSWGQSCQNKVMLCGESRVRLPFVTCSFCLVTRALFWLILTKDGCASPCIGFTAVSCTYSYICKKRMRVVAPMVTSVRLIFEAILFYLLLNMM